MNELVYKSRKGNAITNSYFIAEKFAKRHADVMKAIRNLINQLPDNQHKRIFAPMSKEITLPNNGNRHEPYFIMNRDGFSLLVMGFTGKKALEFKFDYIEAFNKMEEALKKQVPQLPKTYVEALEALLINEKKNLSLTSRIEELEPKARFADIVGDSPDDVSISEAVKLLKLPIGRNNLLKDLRQRGIFFKHKNEPKQAYINQGYFKLNETVFEKDDKTFVNYIPRLTQKGLMWLSKTYKQPQLAQ